MLPLFAGYASLTAGAFLFLALFFVAAFASLFDWSARIKTAARFSLLGFIFGFMTIFLVCGARKQKGSLQFEDELFCLILIWYGAKDCSLEPLILEVQYDSDGAIQVEKCLVRPVHAPFELNARALADIPTSIPIRTNNQDVKETI